MLRLRFLSVALAASFAPGVFVVHADPDTPSQAAARAALQQQMNQTDTEQPPVMTNSTALPATTMPSTTPPPIATPTPQFSTSVPTNVPNDEMESDMASMPTNVTAAAQTKSQTNAPAIAVPPPLVLNTNETEQYPVNPAMAPLPPEGSSATPPMTALQGRPMPMPALSNPVAPPNASSGPGASLKGEPATTNSVPSFENITAPPLPITAEKQAELQNLYSQYMANQITPAQYQDQRAKIMAEP